MTDSYYAHAQFIRPAWAVRDLWRVLVVVFVTDLVFQLSPVLIVTFLPNDTAVEQYYLGTSSFGALGMFFTFGIVALGHVALLRLLHKRGFWSLIGAPAAAWADLVRVVAVAGLVLLALEILPPWGHSDVAPAMRDPGTWALLFPLALLALLVQVGTEEIFFRGYLQQQLACLSPARWVWMGIPSALFGAMHYWNGNGPADGLIWAVWAGMLGLACADLTARTGNLGAAIGLHLVTNMFAVLIYAVDGWPASGLALFVYPHEDPQAHAYPLASLLTPGAVVYSLTLAASVFVIWLAARIAIRR